MTREVVKLAIKDLKKIINDIESKSIIIEEENIKLEKKYIRFYQVCLLIKLGI